MLQCSCGPGFSPCIGIKSRPRPSRRAWCSQVGGFRKTLLTRAFPPLTKLEKTRRFTVKESKSQTKRPKLTQGPGSKGGPLGARGAQKSPRMPGRRQGPQGVWHCGVWVPQGLQCPKGTIGCMGQKAQGPKANGLTRVLSDPPTHRPPPPHPTLKMRCLNIWSRGEDCSHRVLSRERWN